MRRGIGVVLLALAAGSMHASTILKTRAEFRARYSMPANGHIAVENLYGDVAITAWDRDEVLVEAVKHSADPRRLDDARIVIDADAGQVSIHTSYAGVGDDPASVEYHIRVPRRATLDQVRLVNGGLSISGVAGSVRASSVNGGIYAEQLSGQASLSSINGRVEAGFERLSRGSPISLESVNGGIVLWLPAGAGATLSASNLSGGIRADFAQARHAADGHRLDASVNGGGAAIRLHNVNGGISIRATSLRRERPVS